jgi:NDP-sugar pyrophosphorylase family protein
MLNVVIPMAGRGERFRRAGYDVPKPLIQVHGRRMIELVVENLRPARPHRFVFIALAEHVERYSLEALLRDLSAGCAIVPVEHPTDGAARTVLLARDLIDVDEPLMIANADQWLDVDIDRYLAATDRPDLDGTIMTMAASGPKWSYVRLGPDGLVAEVAEKRQLSAHATTGVYNFARGADFVHCAERMIRRGLRVNGEFYVAPVYNQLLEAGGRVAHYDIGAVGREMHCLGTPEDLQRFLAAPRSQEVTGAAL